MSPVEAKLLARADEEKLKGVSLGHFGAFFRRAWRESDYLWGRLDGAELLVELLFDHADEGLPRVEACRRVFEAVLAGERKLRRVKDLRQDLESRVAQLG